MDTFEVCKPTTAEQTLSCPGHGLKTFWKLVSEKVNCLKDIPPKVSAVSSGDAKLAKSRLRHSMMTCSDVWARPVM